MDLLDRTCEWTFGGGSAPRPTHPTLAHCRAAFYLGWNGRVSDPFSNCVPPVDGRDTRYLTRTTWYTDACVRPHHHALQPRPTFPFRGGRASRSRPQRHRLLPPAHGRIPPSQTRVHSGWHGRMDGQVWCQLRHTSHSWWTLTTHFSMPSSARPAPLHPPPLWWAVGSMTLLLPRQQCSTWWAGDASPSVMTYMAVVGADDMVGGVTGEAKAWRRKERKSAARRESSHEQRLTRMNGPQYLPYPNRCPTYISMSGWVYLRLVGTSGTSQSAFMIALHAAGCCGHRVPVPHPLNMPFYTHYTHL